ncbi:MAG: fluoride efflux transporter CrcB [Alphaproteobacteria bacterium]|nr:fluoride efflux transporter CrcB [Alphaproteobacteria bacterium]
MTLLTYFWVGLGGALGSMARLGVGVLVSRALGDAFPVGTLAINVIGSFVITFFSTLTLEAGPLRQTPPDGRAFVVAGVCGGFTTFSSFSLQTFELFRAGEALLGGLNVLASVALCLAAVWVGTVLGRG